MGTNLITRGSNLQTGSTPHATKHQHRQLFMRKQLHSLRRQLRGCIRVGQQRVEPNLPKRRIFHKNLQKDP